MHRATFIALGLLLLVAHTADACPRARPEPFAKFLSQFTQSIDFAVSRTSFPLQATKLDVHANPEPAARSFKLTRKAFKNRGTISVQSQQDGLKMRQQALGQNTAAVHVYKPDTGWLVVYHFHLQDNCWRLRQVDDEST